MDNKIILIDGQQQRTLEDLSELPKGLQLIITGTDNTIIIDEECNFSKTRIQLIGKKVKMGNLIIGLGPGDNEILEIGDSTTFFGGHIYLRDNTHVIIGKNCLFSVGLCIRSTDAHTIFDYTNKHVLNKGAEVLKIGNHCWFGEDVMVLKNGSVSSDSVVGTRSLITKPFSESHIVIAGFPAKVIRKNIDWSRLTIPDYEKRLHK